MTTPSVTLGAKKLSSGDIFSMFIRSNFLLGSFNFERVQALGYCFIMIPAIKRLYGPGAERNEALKRHLEWFNTQPFCSAPILGVTAAMEEEKANGAQIDGKSISGVKVGLMGPFAGVGDPIFWGTIRPVLAALGASLALGGSIFGAVYYGRAGVQMDHHQRTHRGIAHSRRRRPGGGDHGANHPQSTAAWHVAAAVDHAGGEVIAQEGQSAADDHRHLYHRHPGILGRVPGIAAEHPVTPRLISC